jgi:signal transduction histidine kinase
MNDFTILIVDDFLQNIKVLGMILQQEGYSISYALSGKQALEILGNLKVDLVLLDLFMPEMNGIEVCQKIKSNPKYQEIPVIFLTASQEEQSILEAFAVGAADYVTKPFKPLELLARVKNHLQLKQAQEKAEEAAKIKAQFLATMSHEIRTPLQSVLGVTELLMNTRLDSEQVNLLQTLQASGEHLLLIINDILDFSKLEAKEIQLEKNDFSFNGIFEEVFNFLAPQALSKNLELIYLIASDIPEKLIGDCFRLRQILINLVSNGIKFTEAGEIVIRVKKSPKQPKNNQQINLIFEVKDTGIGISEQQQDKLFQCFSQVDISTTRKYGGTGLGLSICRELVTLMGGEIWVESEVNQGSTFYFEIPLELPLNQENIQENIFKNKKLLSYFSNPNNQEFIKINAQHWGIKFDTFSDNVLIIKHLFLVDNSYDFVLIDFDSLDPVQLKDISEAVEKINSQLILSSRITEKLLKEQIKGIKYSYFLEKPLKATSLYKCISLVTNQPKKAESRLAISEKNSSQPLLQNSVESSQPSLKTEGKTIMQPTSEHLPILLVEDNKVNQKVISLLLKKLGYTTDIANHGQECLDQMLEKDYSLIFMDFQMPVLDGYETTERIRTLERENNLTPTIIIGLSANAIPEEKEKCLNIGMNDYITKPVSLETLKETLEKWLKRMNNEQ